MGHKSRIREYPENICDKYSGVVPKENIDLERYKSAAIPTDVKVEDVGKCERAWKHVGKTLFSVKNMKTKLLSRRMNLLDENMAPKDWALDELSFIDNSVEQLTAIMKEIESMVNNLQFLPSQLKKGLIQL